MQLVSCLTPPFWPGLKALAHSLSHKGNIRGLDWIVLTKERVPDEWRDWFGYCGFNMIDLLFSEAGEIPKELPRCPEYWVFGWEKLRMFLFPAGEYIYLDADMLCMGDATEMLTMPSVSVVEGPVGGWSCKGINSGFIRFDASQLLFDECAEEMNAAVISGRFVRMVEQDILNRVFHKHPEVLRCSLGGEWNTKSIGPGPLHGAVFIHFAGRVKPWMNGGAAVNKTWRDYAATI